MNTRRIYAILLKRYISDIDGRFCLYDVETGGLLSTERGDLLFIGPDR
jgi:hypothetical protein